MPIIRPTTPEEAENRLKNAFANQDFGILGSEVESYPLPDRKALLFSSATSAWAERILGAPANPYHPGWQGQKDGIVRSYFGEREAKDISDEDLFGKIASDYQTQDELLTASRIAAARGESWLGHFRDVEKKGKMPAGRQSQYLGLARSVYSEMSEKIAPYRSTIEKVAGMAKGIDTSPEGMDWGAMASELVKVPKEDRPYVLEALSLQSPTANSPEELERVKLAFLRGMERFIDTAVSGVESAGESGAGEFLRQSYGFDVEAQTPEQKAARADFLDLRDDMRSIATGKLAPLKAVRVAGMDISGAAQMLPMTFGAFVPYVGPAAILGSMQRETYNELRANNPDMSREDAQRIATIAAPFQAVTEVISDRLLFGKLPNLKRAFSAPVFSGAGIVGQLGGRVALGAGVEMGEEFVQGMTPLAIQSLASGLKQDVPNADWDGFFEGFADSAPELLSQVLPLALVGAGVGQLSDYRAGRELARSPDLLIAARFTPDQATKISDAANAGKWREAEDLMRADWATVNAKAESPSEVTRQARVAAINRIAEEQAPQTEEAKRAAELLQKAESEGMIPRILRDAKGWAVEDAESGAVVRVSSRDEAIGLAMSRLDDNAREEAQAMAKVLEAYSSGVDILELDLGKSMDLAETGETEAAMKEAAITEAMLNGMTREQAEKITWAVMGTNNVETVEGVRRVVSRLFRGAGVMDAIEEPIEGKFKAGLEQGAFTSDEAMNFVKIAAEVMKAPELLTTAQSSARGLVEAISDIVMADTFGQRKDGRKGVAGAVTAGLKAKLRRQAELSGAESKFAAFLAAFRRFFKQVFKRSRALLKARKEGTLTGDFDEFLDRLMNVDPQRRHDAAAAKEALEIAQAGNMAFSLAPKEQDAEYLAAVESGDIAKAQAMVDEAAKAAGYLPHGDFRDSHGAPSNQLGTDEDVKNGDADASLVQVARGVHNQPDDYFDPRVGPRYYSYQDKAGMEAFKALRAAMDKIQRGKKALVTVYRAVPIDIKGTKLENRDWVTPSKTYAVDHGESRFGEDEYRIIKESVPAESLFWDGNDIREWGKDDAQNYFYKNTANNIKSADPVTRDESGNVIPLSERFNPETPDIRFSLAPRSLPEVADTILAAQMKKPAFFEAFVTLARRKLDKLRKDRIAFKKYTVEGADSLAQRSAEEIAKLDQKRKDRIAQVTEDLIAGGMDAKAAKSKATLEANEDFRKARQELPSEKERQMMALRTLDAILSAFPQPIRDKVGGFVKLAEYTTDAAREKEITRRLAKLEEVIEEEAKKHYTAKIGKMLDRYKSQKDSSGRISGKLISTATEQVDYAAQIADLDVAAQAEKGDALESLIEKSDDADVVQDALNKLGILRMFETMNLKDSLALESAAEWLESTIEQGKLGKKIVDEARKEFLDEMRQDAQAQVLDGKALNIDDANNLTNVNRAPMLAMVQRLRGMMSEALWTTVQRLEIIFGEGSKASEYFAGRAVAAANKSNDIKRAVSAQQREILSVIFGSESKFAHARGVAKLQTPRKSGVMVRRPVTKDVTLDMETLTKLADGTITPETAGIREDELQTAMDEWAASDRKRSVTITQVVNVGEETNRFMSELQGIQWRLWWNQADSKKQMERDGWSDESIKQLDAFLSDEAKALGEWITDSYGEAAKMIDPVYRRLFNAPLPRIKGYAPIYRMTLSTSADVMDLGNSDMNSGLAAGFTKSRVNTTAPLLEIDALAAFLSHWENVSHWVSHAELMRDMKAILLDKNVSTAIRQKKGDGALSRLKEDVKTIETNGTNSAKELTSLSRGWRWLMQYRAYKGLAFRISPIMKQTPALLNPLLADVPAHNYAAGLARAFLSPQEFAANVAAMWKSDIVRRRIDGGFSAEAKIAQQGASMTGSQAIVFMQSGMMPMAYVDAGWTAMGAAVAFDYYKRSYMAQNEGTTPEMADAAATARLERMIAASAQPSDVYARALYERSGNAFMRSMAMFVSDQRKALAIELLAIRKLITGKSKNKALDVQRALVAHFIQAAVSQVMAGALASMFGDDDDKEREWSTEQWALALSLGPVNGLFVLGRLIDKTGRILLGLRVFPNNDLAGKAADDLIRGTKSMDELFNPDDAEDVMTSLDALSTAAGSVGSALFGPASGAVDVSANLVREGIKITKALAEEE